MNHKEKVEEALQLLKEIIDTQEVFEKSTGITESLKNIRKHENAVNKAKTWLSQSKEE